MYMMNKLYLYFPQWQGSGKTNEIYVGASVLKDKLSETFQFVEISQPQVEELETEHNIVGYQRILKNLETVREVLKKASSDRVFTLGGDCGIEIAPVTYLNKQYDSDFLILWFDAHGDVNTPESSLSKTFHGMPLRIILGEGDATLMRNCFSSLQPHQVILVGTRNLDQPEKFYIQKNNITLFTSEKLDLEKLTKVIKEKEKKNIYIHLDLDVIDPEELPDVKCPTANGLSFSRIQELVTTLKKNFNVVGGSLVEYTPKQGVTDKRVVNLAKLIFNS